MALKGLQILYNLILKSVAKDSGQASGILSIGKDVRKLADKKLQRYITAAKKQGVDLDNLSEEQAKYMLELNKPKAPRVFSNEEAYKFLNQFLNQGKKGEVIRGKFKPLITVDSVIADIKKLKPMDSMKETNKVLKGEGKYKTLSKADREKIAGDESVTDHIFERNIIDETEDFAQGGPAGLSYLLAEDTNERMPLAGGGYLPMGMWGDIAEAFEKYQEENKDSVGPLMSYKQFWNNYIDNLASGGRVGFSGGGSGKPPISGSAFATIKGTEGSDVLQPGLTLNQKGYSGNVGGNINLPLGQGNIGLQGLLGFGRNKYNVDYQGQNVASGVGETKLGDVWNVGAEYNRPLFGGTVGIGASLDQDSNKQGNISWRKKFAGGGMGRRAFLKLMAALGLTGAAAKYGLPTLFKKATPKVAKELTEVPIKNIEGMPAWFKPLVNKVIQEGDDVTKKWATQERQIVHKTKLPESQTDVLVHQDLDSGDVWVDIGIEKHGFPDGKFGQPVRLEYKASEEIEPVINSWTGKVDTKGKKTPEEFNVEEAEFTGGHPENVKFEETSVNKFGEHESDFREIEKFATGKNTVKGQIGSESKSSVRKYNRMGKSSTERKIDSWDKQSEDLADYFSNYPEPDDYASGGIAKMLGE